MKHMVSYTLKPDRVDENERLIVAMFAALDETRPAGLGYASYRRDDGVSFVHLVSHDEPPVRVELAEIGSYGLFGR